MAELMNESRQNNTPHNDFQFKEEIEIEDSGFSFHPITGVELEIDGSVYMYSKDGNLEISLIGGELDNETSIAELNNQLTAKCLEHVDEYDLIESGTDTIHGITGFLNKITFKNVEEQGIGQALICSPFINQYFFILVIASADYWHNHGERLFDALKSKVDFHPQFTHETPENEVDQYSDLTIETFSEFSAEDDFILTIEKGDLSLLLAARSVLVDEQVVITQVTAPGGHSLYSYDPISGIFSSTLCEQPLVGSYGEVCLFYPRNNQQPLTPGDYQFTFATPSGEPLQEVQVIIRSGRALDLQKVDLNIWLALENEHFYHSQYIEQFEADLYHALKKRMAPINLIPGKITCFHPAPDELPAFNTVNLDTDLADCSYIISESVNNGRALNIGLVENFITGDPPVISNIDAASSGSPGMILSPDSPHTSILIRWSVDDNTINDLAETIIQQLIVFSGIDTQGLPSHTENQHLILNHEIAWRLRRHPLFYDAD